MRIVSLILLLVALVSIPGIAIAGETTGEDAEQIRMDVDLEDASLTQALEVLRKATDVNFAVDPAVFRDTPNEDFHISLKLKDVKAEAFLKLLLKLYGLAVTTTDDIAVITLPRLAAAEQEPVTVVYEVFDLSVIKHRPSFFGNYRNYGSYNVTDYPRFTTYEYDPQYEYYRRWRSEQRPLIDPERLIELIITSVPANWDEEMGTSIAYANGLLVINQPPEVQLQIAKLLYRLRMRH